MKANGGITQQKISWIPASIDSSSKKLAKLFDKCYMKGHCDIVKKAFQLIDSSIDNAITLNIGEPLIYLVRQPSNVMPLSLFGDSLNRVADLFLKLVSKWDFANRRNRKWYSSYQAKRIVEAII